MTTALSVLDLVPLGDGIASGTSMRNSIELAQLADRLGYRRHWFAEHHNMSTIASTTPEIMVALAGAATRGIHVGAGGVMLPNHAPLKVAESWKMLEALYPGRVDLGIGRAPGTDPLTALALRGSRQALGADDFPDRLGELIRFGRAGASDDNARVAAVPLEVSLPPIWLLGSSDFSAQLAAALGLGFGFAAHFSDLPAELPMQIYRRQWRGAGQPHAILTLSIICAPTDAEAAHLGTSLTVAFARLRTGQRALLLPPDEAAAYRYSDVERAVAETMRARHIFGSPATVKARVDELVRRTAADEVMITTFTYGKAERMRSYELMARAFDLPPRGEL